MRVEDCRAALTVGFRHGLQSKDHRIVDWTLEHERAIEQITPLAKALARFKESSWQKMSLVERVNFASPLLKTFNAFEQDLGLAYVEATGAADLLKLPKDDRRIVIDGAYACYRLDWLAHSGNKRRDGLASEMKRHVKTVITVANDLTEYALAEKIDAATATLPKIIAFADSALFDQFKGHLIAATKLRLRNLQSPFGLKIAPAEVPPKSPAPVGAAPIFGAPLIDSAAFKFPRLYELTGISDPRTLADYMKKAGLPPTKRGGRHRVFTKSEVMKLLETITTESSESPLVSKCKASLQTIN